MDNNKELEKIYVIGFPKSGNTWLTRLLADVLKCPAGNGMVGKDDIEISSDFNRVILKDVENPNYKILKTHFLPEVMNQAVDNNIKRAVYIMRDFRDIVISAFYHKYKTEEEDLLPTNFMELFSRGLLKFFLYYRNRFRLWKLINSIGRQWGKRVGSWDRHIKKWKEFNNSNPDTLIAFTTYEDLLGNTEDEVLKIIRNLKIPSPSIERLQASIYRQSFQNKKEHFSNIHNNQNIPLGREFNYRFMRKGIVGDWKNVLTVLTAKKIHKLQGDAIIGNGYEDDRYWYNRFPFISKH
jgi:hypothetical protein